MNNIDLQIILENEKIKLSPLQENDFECLYAVAADPKIWEQHPNKDRWKREVFITFFNGAMESKGAFKIIGKASSTILGSTRIYNHKPETDSIFIGYTFYSTNTWGKGINAMVKNIMLIYLFQFVSKIYFHVGADNHRSQIAIERIGAKKVSEEKICYVGDTQPRLNFLYEIKKETWQHINTP